MQTVKNVVVNRLSPALGAEVIGMDLSKQSSEATEFVRRTLHEHHFVCIRNQQLTEEQQINFSRSIGEIEPFPEEERTTASPQVFHVSNVSLDGSKLTPEHPLVIAQKVNERFHTDSSYRFEPSYASFLYVIEPLAPDAKGGETEFSNSFMAYEALPAEVKAQIEPLHMVHAFINGRRLVPEMRPLTMAEQEALPPACHPLVRVHPDRDGRRSLFFSANVSCEVSGVVLEEGRRLHRLLEEHIQSPAFCYKHKWKKGDLMIWDNRAVAHRACPYDLAKHRRVALRTVVAGRGPVHGPYSKAKLD